VNEPLPNLVIAGVEKAGTTSLFNYLGQHPDICASLVKELGFFLTEKRASNYMVSFEDYARQFSHCQGERYRLEASPAYVSSGISIAREMKQTLDRPKVIVTLRDPTARLWSAYRFRRSQGHLEEQPRLELAIDHWQRRTAEPSGTLTRSPLSVGRYADYLGDWLAELGDDLMVVFAEHLAADPADVTRRICRWLDVDDTVAYHLDYTSHNATFTPRSRLLARAAYRSRRYTNWWLRKAPPLRAALRGAYGMINADNRTTERLDPAQAAFLDDYYGESNAALAGLLKDAGYEQFPAWLERHATP